MDEAILLRGAERLLIVIGAIILSYLGYKLYRFGIDKGSAKLETESQLYKVVFSGTGPGLFFMAFGAIILITALITGGAKSSYREPEKLSDDVSTKELSSSDTSFTTINRDSAFSTK
ncbi:hypothetical protein IH879_17185 [candidate division KSB1 bacterium]|nr:hypothetical protein [candidate division KSB1 bacterium]